MIVVFATNISNKDTAREVIETLLEKYSNFIFSIDVEDCDNVLRVEGSFFKRTDIIAFVQALGFDCEELLH